MSAHLHSNHAPEEICLNKRGSEHEGFVQGSADLIVNATILDRAFTEDKEPSKDAVKEDISEHSRFETNANPGDSVSTKTYNIRESHETSPFKQAVKGFVLNKLSKKVGSSHLLSGLTEKIVKKLEESRENSPNAIQNASGEKNRITQKIKESNIELCNDPIPCELKSVVANDISEISSVEEAIECFEESKIPLNGDENNGKLYLKPKITSRSLPSSPARHSSFRSSDIDHSDSEEKSFVSEFNNVSSFSSKIYQNLDLETAAFKHESNIELKNMSTKQLKEKYMPSLDSKSDGYYENAYVKEKSTTEKLFPIHKYPHALVTLKDVLVCLPLSHLFLIISIIIHNSKSFSSFYIDYIFDAFIIAYVIYTLICIVIQIPSQHVPLHTTYSDTKLEMTAIHQSEIEETMKGSVKILRGKYDPEEQMDNFTELVNICIENQCLKISHLPKNDDSDENIGMPFEVYDLCGAVISLVPEGLPKRRIFRKKFPICIMLPSASKKLHSDECTYEDIDQEEKFDYVSLFPYQDGLIETPRSRALYIFALSDREKETWFWALQNAVKPHEKGTTEYSSLYSNSPKFDITSLSYSSLLEVNMDETLSITEESSELGPEINLLPQKIKPTLDFGEYMKTLFENYLREINAGGHSWKSENIKTKSFSVEWMNVALGRLFYDFLTQKYWSNRIIEKIQKKLNQIEMPTFMETLVVTDVFMGTCVPQLHSIKNPVSDKFGLWLDFDFTYNGSFQMTLQTKLKMPKTKLQSDEQPENPDIKQNNDANESSEEDGSPSRKSPNQNKFITKIEKWISHKHFQTVAQSRFVKKYVGDISNMLLTLTVEVNLLQGILAVNIPPVPTDRVWYGFRKDPILSLTASPKVGSHEINLSAIVKMIEQKLLRAFKKAIVMPQMDDLIIPLMFSPVNEGSQY